MNNAIKALLEFRDKRDWKQFHTPRNLSNAISIEAAELNELFLWKSEEDVKLVDKVKIQDELADVLSYCLLLCDAIQANPEEIILNKIIKNEERYPVNRSKGNAKKYNEL